MSRLMRIQNRLNCQKSNILLYCVYIDNIADVSNKILLLMNGTHTQEKKRNVMIIIFHNFSLYPLERLNKSIRVKALDP